MSQNAKLGIVAIVFLALSLLSYNQSTHRGERFNRGQKLFPNLNPDEVAEITINKKDETTALKRQDDGFVVSSIHQYPAKNEAINRFLNDVLEISLAKEIGRSADLETELGLSDASPERMEISFKNNSGKEMVHFLIGKNIEGGSGTYVLRTDKEKASIYLTDKSLYLTTDAPSFLEKEILNLNQSDIAKIQGPDFLIEDKEGKLVLADVPGNKQEKASEVSKIKGLGTSLSFDSVLVADDPSLSGLNFQEQFVIELKDQTGYRFSVAQKDKDTYIQVEGFHTVKPFQLDPNESEEEVRKKSEILERVNAIQTFNQFHATWTYKLPEFSASKFLLSKKDLIEDKKTDS